MTSSKFEEIKEIIESAGESINKMEGANERILQQLKNDYESKSIEKAKAIVEQIESELETDLNLRNKLLTTLEEAADWDNI